MHGSNVVLVCYRVQLSLINFRCVCFGVDVCSSVEVFTCLNKVIKIEQDQHGTTAVQRTRIRFYDFMDLFFVKRKTIL